jgi:hypothetical protein
MYHRLVSATRLSLLCLPFLVVACTDDTGRLPFDAGTTEASPPPPVDGGAAIRGMAVLGSDYSSSSLSLLDRDGNVVKDGCFNSGTGGGGLSMTLSGDVVLPTRIPVGSDILLVDRSNAVLTWIDPASCAPLRQLSVATGFAPNPHDVAVISATKAYVTRADQNATPTPALEDFDEGSDLLIIDPSQAKIVGHIDLKPFAPAPDVLPRADRALLIDGTVFVSLNAISADYVNATYGTGRIVMVNSATDQVVGTIDLPGAKNCGALDYIPSTKQLLVACDGAYSDGPQQSTTSAIVVVDVAAAPPAVVAQIPAADVGGLPFGNGAIAALDANTILGVTLGTMSNLPPDRLWAVHVDGSLPVKVFESAEGYALSALLVDREKGRVFAADATTLNPAFLRTFTFATGAFSADKTIKSEPTHKLPPRALAWF